LTNHGVGSVDPAMTDVTPIVTEIAEDWLARARERADESLRSPHRAPCASCVASPLLPALGEFGAWPHPLIHPLLHRITDMLDDISEQRFAAASAELRSLWHSRVDLDDDGEAPDEDHLAWAARVHARELGDLREVEAESSAWDDWVAASALAGFCAERAELAREVTAGLVDRAVSAIEALEDGATIDAAEAADLRSALDAALVDWVVWLPTGKWRRMPAIGQGSICELCSELGFRERFDAPHGAVHRFSDAVSRVISTHIGRHGAPRVEPPAGDAWDDYLVQLSRLGAAWLEDNGERLERALRVYVADDVMRTVSAASTYLPVVTDDDGDMAPGEAPR
jgi:hypothetical protein